jgi:hypothetical protein
MYLILIISNSGGAKMAPTIRDNDSWSNLVNQLKGNHDTVHVTLSLKDLEPYQNHKRVSMQIFTAHHYTQCV